MNKLLLVTDASPFAPERSGLPGGVKRIEFTIDGYRRLLSEMRVRPLSQRVFLQKLLRRAVLNGAIREFPVPNHARPDPVDLA